MDFMSLVFIFVTVTLFLITEAFWSIQKLHKIAAFFAALQLVSVYVAMQFFHLDVQQLVFVMLGYFFIAISIAYYRIRMRIKKALSTAA